MTREQAKREIDFLDYYLQNHTDDYGEESHTAMMMAIQALEQEPSVSEKPNNCDLISRQAVLDKFQWHSGDESNKYLTLWTFVENMPPVKPQEKKGHWISFGVQGEMDGGQIVQAFTCSECGTISIFRMRSGNIVNGDICPNCGAKMEVKQNG